MSIRTLYGQTRINPATPGQELTPGEGLVMSKLATFRHQCGIAFIVAIATFVLAGVPEDRAVCGNASVDADEQCDDGNTLDGDCCSASCQYEAAYSTCAGDEATLCEQMFYVCDGSGQCILPRLYDACYAPSFRLGLLDNEGEKSDKLFARSRLLVQRANAPGCAGRRAAAVDAAFAAGTGVNGWRFKSDEIAA